MHVTELAKEAPPIQLPSLAKDLLFKRPGWEARWEQYKRTQPAIARRRLPWLLVVCMSVVVFSQYFAVAWVTTQSVNAHVVLVIKGAHAKRGDLVAMYYNGMDIGGHRKGDRILKVLAGLPGDQIDRSGRDFFINGSFVGTAKEKSGVAKPGWIASFFIRIGLNQGYPSIPLEAAQAGIVPPGKCYVMGTDKDALDSRYAAMGLVDPALFIGRAIKVF